VSVSGCARGEARTVALVVGPPIDEILELLAAQVFGLHADDEANGIHEVGLTCELEKTG